MEEKKQTEKRKHSFVKKTILFLILFLGCFFSYIHFVEPNIITVKEYAIVDNKLPYSFHGLKIVEFSDVYYGCNMDEKKLEKIITKINELKPDVVFYAGDLICNSVVINEESENKVKELLGTIQAKLKKYAVLGDQDYTDKIRYMELLESAEFTILNNKSDLLYYGSAEPILFIGTTSLLEKEVNLEEAITNTEDISSYYKIWLSHEPLIMDRLENFSVKPNLIFSGHTLGGLFRLPFFSTMFQEEGTGNYTKDFYQKGIMKMYISNGVGTSKYPVRFLNPPSISLYRFYQY